MIKAFLEFPGKLLRFADDIKFRNSSYAQEGEDMILQRYFEGKLKGFYIDIGAHHPKKYSNTYAFYRKGWSGINIDAMPGSMKLFNSFRKRDINLEKAVFDTDKELTYFQFNEPALNGFSEEISRERDDTGGNRIIASSVIKTEKLSSILDIHMPVDIEAIDFMTIDVEGVDLNVLKSNNWIKYRPKIVIVELLNNDLHEKDPIFEFLINKEYKFYAKTHYTNFFVDTQISK